ncbi:MAG TPA: hypothetical protein VEM41_02275 [Actinomycetota bacterium]|nr:hypothetical protein [Actinomycetota bacterium]
MDPLVFVGWAGTLVALAVAGLAGWTWRRGLSDLLFTRSQVRRGVVPGDEAARVVARWHATTGRIKFWFVVVLAWLLMPGVPPTAEQDPKLMAVGAPLAALLGVTTLLVTDLRFRARLRRIGRDAATSNVVAFRRPRRGAIG